MSKLNMVIQHKLTEEEALKRTKGLLEEIKTQFTDEISNLKEKWDKNSCEFSFSSMGFSVSGKIIVKSSQIELTGNLPLAAIFFKNKIETTIRERAEILLA